jgi:hypothetical protein
MSPFKKGQLVRVDPEASHAKRISVKNHGPLWVVSVTPREVHHTVRCKSLATGHVAHFSADGLELPEQEQE